MTPKIKINSEWHPTYQNWHWKNTTPQPFSHRYAERQSLSNFSSSFLSLHIANAVLLTFKLTRPWEVHMKSNIAVSTLYPDSIVPLHHCTLTVPYPDYIVPLLHCTRTTLFPCLLHTMYPDYTTLYPLQHCSRLTTEVDEDPMHWHKTLYDAIPFTFSTHIHARTEYTGCFF